MFLRLHLATTSRRIVGVASKWLAVSTPMKNVSSFIAMIILFLFEDRRIQYEWNRQVDSVGSCIIRYPNHSPSIHHNFVWSSCFWFFTLLAIPLSGGTWRHRPGTHTHTQLFHMQLCHTPCFTHTTRSHTIFHTQPPSFVIHNQAHLSQQNFIRHNSWHTTFFTYRSSTTSFVFPSFPVQLQLLFLLVGRSWLVGFSGPVIEGETVNFFPSGTITGK